MELAACRTMTWRCKTSVLAVLVVLCLPGRALPCEFARLDAHQVDAAAQQVDRTAPTLAPAPAVKVQRGTSPQHGCTGTLSSSCDGSGSIAITPTVADERALPAEIGFRMRLLSGSLPQGLNLPGGDVRARSGGLYFHWDDGYEADHEEFSFTLEIIAVDTAGNPSPPVQVVISDGGSGGCSIGRSSGSRATGPGLLPCLILGAAAMLYRRRRRA